MSYSITPVMNQTASNFTNNTAIRILFHDLLWTCMRFLWDKPGEELLGHRIYTIWLNPDSLQDGGTSALSHQLFRGFPITHSSQHVALLYFLTFTNLIGIKWCLFVISMCAAPVTSLNQFAFDLCDSVTFFSCVSSIGNVSQALFRASHKYHLVFLPCLLSSLMAIRCNQRQTNSFL